MGRRKQILSVGYEGFTIDEFVTHLLENDVDLLVDVRLTPLSRKSGFSKRRLSEAVSAAGIEYVHEKSLGNPKDNRDPFWTGRQKQGARRFRNLIAKHGEPAVEMLKRRSKDSRVALMCFEESVEKCHRGVILEILEEASPRLTAVPI